MQSQVKTITHFNEAINHKYSIPGYLHGFCKFMTRSIKDSNDQAEIVFEWHAKYLYQKNGVSNANRHALRLHKAQEKKQTTRKRRCQRTITS